VPAVKDDQMTDDQMDLPCPLGSECASFRDVEHPCQQCDNPVEDGRAFCPQCRAPQIHVRVPVPDIDVIAADSPVETGLAASQERHPAFPGALDSGLAVRSALKAGAIGVFIGVIPVLGVVLTGALAVYFYRRKNRFALPAGIGARLGGAAGVVVFAVNALFTIPIIVLHAQQECVDQIVDIAKKYGVDTAAPQFQASIHSLFTPSGLAAFFIIAVVLSSTGGALAAFLLRPNTRL
jgi:hypothetical protein